MSVQSVEIKDACRTWRAKDGSSYYVTLSHVCRDSRIGTGVGKPLVGLPPAFGLGRNKTCHTKAYFFRVAWEAKRITIYQSSVKVAIQGDAQF
jgi:hypothetical protein